MLKVQPVTVNGQKLFGVTDGKKWFWWAYTLEASAKKMAVGLTPEIARRVNVCHERPYEVSTITPDEIQ